MISLLKLLTSYVMNKNSERAFVGDALMFYSAGPYVITKITDEVVTLKCGRKIVDQTIKHLNLNFIIVRVEK